LIVIFLEIKKIYNKECFLPKIKNIINKEILKDIIFSYSYDGESSIIEWVEQHTFQLAKSLN